MHDIGRPSLSGTSPRPRTPIASELIRPIPRLQSAIEMDDTITTSCSARRSSRPSSAGQSPCGGQRSRVQRRQSRVSWTPFLSCRTAREAGESSNEGMCGQTRPPTRSDSAPLSAPYGDEELPTGSATGSVDQPEGSAGQSRRGT
jgi:hypothetical protein